MAYDITKAGPLLVILLASAIIVACRETTTSPSLPTGDMTSEASQAAATTPLAFRQLTSGDGHTCGVTLDDRAWCWGSNVYGELGDGTRARRLRPTAVLGGLRFLHVSVGSQHSCGVTTDFRAFCWGRNDRGQLGDGTTVQRSIAVRVAVP